MLSYFKFLTFRKIGLPFISHIVSLLAYKSKFERLRASARHRATEVTKAAEHYQDLKFGPNTRAP